MEHRLSQRPQHAETTPAQDNDADRSPGVGKSIHPCLKPHFRCEIIPPKTVYLIGEFGSHALTGGLYCTIVPLLDGTRTMEDIHAELGGDVPMEHIVFVLDRLKASGYLVDAEPGLSRAAAAFWTQLGFEPVRVAKRLERVRVAATAVGDIDTAPLLEELASLGLHVVESDAISAAGRGLDLRVVVTDDHLRPELAALNKAALGDGTPWVLVKPAGAMPWIGPLFVPGETGCWSCLSHRLRGNDEVRSTILRQKAAHRSNSARDGGSSMEPPPDCLPVSIATLPTTRRTAVALAATEIAKALVMAMPDTSGHKAGRPAPSLQGALVTLDLARLAMRRHPLPHRPQCPDCGEPTLVHRRGFEPVELAPCRKTFTRDGGHRAVTPEQTLARYDHLIDPLTGVVTELTRISDPDNPLVHNYHAGQSMAGMASSLSALRRALRNTNGGKGKTDVQSRASGFCEAIERYSGVFQGDEPRIRASYEALGDQAIHPERYLGFSDLQYAQREERNREAKTDNAFIPQRLDPRREIDWTPVWSLTKRRHLYLPTALCFYGAPTPHDMRFAFADSNGCAAGNTLEEAALQGYLELIERDSVSIWWHNRVTRPRVDLDSFGEPYFRQLTDYYRGIGREVWVLDVSSDFGIPVFVAVSRRMDGPEDRVIIRFGAHLDAAIAIERALTELNQAGRTYDDPVDERTDPAAADWLVNVRVSDHPYLAPAPNLPPRTPQDYPAPCRDDIRDDVIACANRAAELGLETFLLNQTRPDLGLNVVKVIVPGLRHYWRRLGPGRLYTVPVAMGWRQTELGEGEINPLAIPSF